MGVNVLFEKEQIDTAKMSSEIMLALTGTQAQDESFAISTNMRWSYEKRMRSGEFNGCYTPYGYRFQDRKLTIYEPEAVVVRQIFEMYLSGYGISRITRCLKEQEVPHRYGEKEWNYDSYLKVVTSKPGHILDDYSFDNTGFYSLYHSLEVRAVKGRAGVTIVYEELIVRIAIFFTPFVKRPPPKWAKQKMRLGR